MKIELYGIPEEVGRCYGCRRVKSMFDDLKLDYSYNKVMTNTDTGIQYDRPLIVSLASRLGQTSLNISYPVIFINDVRVKNFNELKTTLLTHGCDESIIEDYT